MKLKCLGEDALLAQTQNIYSGNLKYNDEMGD
jgi:hypothetical protein